MSFLSIWSPLMPQNAQIYNSDLYRGSGSPVATTTFDGNLVWSVSSLSAVSKGNFTLFDYSMTDAYFHVRFGISALPSSTPRGFEPIALFGVGSDQGLAVVVNENGTLSIGYFSDIDYEIIETTSTAIDINHTYRLECKHSKAGGYSVRLDGTVILSGSCAAWPNQSAASCTIYVGSWAYVRGNTDAMSITVYLWDLATASGEWPAGTPASGQVIRLELGANGFYEDWTQGTGTTIAEVDDYPHDNDTTYLKTDVTGRVSFSLTNLPDLENIKCLRVFATLRNEASGGANSHVAFTRVSSTDYDIRASYHGPSTSYMTASWLRTNNPSTSQAWTANDLATAEFGMSHDVTGTKATRMTNLGILIWGTIPPLEANLTPVAMSLSAVSPALLLGPILEPVRLSLGVPTLERSMGAISPEPVVLHTRIPSVALVKERFTLPTARGQWWTVGTTPPLVVREGYVWVDTSDPGSPVIYQYIDNVWVDTLGGYTEAVTREVMDGGGSSSASALTTIVNLTGLNIPASKHIIIDAFFTNTNGVGQVSAVELQLNGVAVMSGVAMPGTGTGEIGTWRIVIPRRDRGDLGGRSYLVVPPDTQTVTTLTSVPQNAPITSIALRANPNGTAFEIRNVLVRSLLAQISS